MEKPMERIRLAGGIRRPSAERIRKIAEGQFMRFSDEETADIGALIDLCLGTIERLDDFPVADLPVKYPNREKGIRPMPSEDPLNIFIRRCRVEGAHKGRLAAKTVALKDNIRLALVPMTNASRLMHEYIPSIDATVAERLLDAGATIVGKTNLDNFSMGGTSETGDYGAVRNPFNPDYSAGGSSGGSGAAVGAGLVDIAIGVDQGGSARIPASWCGAAAIKGTHGLIPSFGITHLDHSIDHVCPIAANVEDLALAMEAIAGDDPNDPQWVRGPIRTAEYSKALGKSVSGTRVGVIREAFDWPDSEPDVNAAVGRAIKLLQDQGATVEEITVPWWKECAPILLGLLSHSHSAMVESDQEGYWRGGRCDPGWQEAFGKARRAGSDGFPPLLKVQMIMGKYLREDYCSVYFSKAQNARLTITADLDRVLQSFDVLVTPTVQMKAVRLTRKLRPGSWEGRGAIDCNKNCSPLNLTGHPALTIPCGIGESNLPIGVQLIGGKWEEATLFQAASAIERLLPDEAMRGCEGGRRRGTRQE
jgi:amidase